MLPIHFILTILADLSALIYDFSAHDAAINSKVHLSHSNNFFPQDVLASSRLDSFFVHNQFRVLQHIPNDPHQF